MSVPEFAMFVSSLGVLLRLCVLAQIVMMGSLMVMVGGSMVMGGGLMMMLTGRMLRRLCHLALLPNQLVKTKPVVRCTL
jgi:hypothetical protein